MKNIFLIFLLSIFIILDFIVLSVPSFTNFALASGAPNFICQQYAEAKNLDTYNLLEAYDEQVAKLYRTNFGKLLCDYILHQNLQKTHSRTGVRNPELILNSCNNQSSNDLMAVWFFESETNKNIATTPLSTQPQMELSLQRIGNHEIDKAIEKFQKNIATLQKNTNTSLPRTFGEYSRIPLLLINQINEPHLNSWTNSAYAFYFLKEPSELKQENFLRAIAHEQAVYFDDKAILNQKNFLASYRELSQEAVQEIQNIFANNKGIAWLFSAIRAYRVESYWTQQINLQMDTSTQFPDTASEGSCLQEISRWIKVISEMFHDNLCSTQKIAFDEKNLITGYQLIQSISQKYENNNIFICQFLVRPLLSDRHLRFAEGPRPRIGGRPRGRN